MLVVSMKPAEPEWVPVLGAEVLFAPIDRTMLLRARRTARDLSTTEPADSGRPAADLLEEIGDAVSQVLILAGARDWRGVTAASENDPETYIDLPFSPENLAAALADPITFEAFDAAYVQPFARREREREAPGKGSPRSPDGTGTKAPEGQTTATSPAPATAADANSVPTDSTKPRRKPKKASGAS